MLIVFTPFLSQDVDFFRRYGMMKGMIKRSVLHLKLGNEDTSQVQVSAGKQKEDMRKREERLTGRKCDSTEDGMAGRSADILEVG